MDHPPVDYCPACRSDALVPGHFAELDGHPLNETGVMTFRARGGSVFRPVAAVRMHTAVRACYNCGLVWSTLPPEALREAISSRGDELLRQRVAVFEGGPLHDLPECHEARVAAECVAEIDRLIWAGETLEATRRYRQYTGRAWDDVHAAIGAWAKLTRAEKLALLGWEELPKKKGGKAGLDSSTEHPLHDAELDGP